jgi:hypothetical protein
MGSVLFSFALGGAIGVYATYYLVRWALVEKVKRLSPKAQIKLKEFMAEIETLN